MMRLRHVPLATLALVMILLGSQERALASKGSFIDDDNSRWEAFIETAHQEGIVTGCNPPENDRFCPHHLVTRGTLAIMLARAIGAQPADGDHFVDDDGHHAEGAIEALIGTGMRFGCELERFCPDRPITRGEMAALIARALKWDLPSATGGYKDLAGSPFSAAMVELAERGGLEPCDAPANQRLCPRDEVRRDEAVFSLVAALGLEPNKVEPGAEDPSLIDFGDSFDELSLWDGRSPSYRNRVRLTNDGFKATALDVRIPEGSHFGADFRLDFSSTLVDEPEQLFFRYFLRLDPDWATKTSGKLPGFSGVYGRSGKGGYGSRPWEPGWSARLMFSPTSDSDRLVRLGYYVYHLGQGTQFGDKLRWNESGKLLPGEWYCLEGEVELNTLGLADGALRAWVDGTPAFDATGLEFRRPSEPEIRIESFWFNVYYGGKAVAENDLGLTIDEVVVDTKRIGCEVGDGTGEQALGDFNSDGYRDRIWWDTCPIGSCFWIEATSASGNTSTRQVGSGAWFSLETHRLGLSTGDLDGDGAADVLYRGRCDGSVRCWRVHQLTDAKLGVGQNWGDDARFSPSTASLTLGDWDGDGIDDLVYQAHCGDDAHACWRMHPSNGNGFDQALDFGPSPQNPLFPLAADVTGDGLADLVYPMPCEHGNCWVLQESTGSSFAPARSIGQARNSELDHSDLIDFDGDGDADLVSWRVEGDRSRIEVRFTRPNGLTRPILLAEVDEEVRDVLLRRIQPGSPIQALVRYGCEGADACFAYMVSPSSRKLTDPGPFRAAMGARYRGPTIN